MRGGNIAKNRANFTAARAALAALFIVTNVGAFCRTTTCNPNDSTAPNACQYDSNGCPTNGSVLSWPQACVAFSIQKDASPLRNITFDTMETVTGDAYNQWSLMDCGGGLVPSIGLVMRSPVDCDAVEYNRIPGQPNANIWMFRDQEWPYGSVGTLALTTVSFDAITGEILDADVELNSAQENITVGDVGIDFDLASIVQHESGHTLGLAHSPVKAATMYAQYTPGEVLKRSLSADDIAGICAIYPPGQNRGACDPTPIHGFSTECQAAGTGSGDAGTAGDAGTVGDAGSAEPEGSGGAGGAAASDGGSGAKGTASGSGDASVATATSRAGSTSDVPPSDTAGVTGSSTQGFGGGGCDCHVAGVSRLPAFGWLATGGLFVVFLGATRLRSSPKDRRHKRSLL